MTDEVIGVGKRKEYHVLNALRGIAALFVVLRHTGSLGFWGGYRSHYSYLAVDLFFVLSGFVVYHAYADKLRTGGMTLKGFVVQRLVRLWPMYALSIVMILLLRLVYVGWDVFALLALLKLFFLSGIFVPSHSTDNSMFPLNDVAWSLMFELIVNILFALTHKWLKLAWIVLFALIGFGICCAAQLQFGRFDFGWALSATDFVVGLGRASFGFFVGVLLFKLNQYRPIVTGKIVWVFSVLILLGVMVMPFAGRFEGLFLISVLVIWIPLCVYIGIVSECANVKVCDWLGSISYPVYVLHVPVYMYYVFIARNVSKNWLQDAGIIDGVVYLGVLLLFVMIILARFDLQSRNLMRSFFARFIG